MLTFCTPHSFFTIDYRKSKQKFFEPLILHTAQIHIARFLSFHLFYDLNWILSMIGFSVFSLRYEFCWFSDIWHFLFKIWFFDLFKQKAFFLPWQNLPETGRNPLSFKWSSCLFHEFRRSKLVNFAATSTKLSKISVFLLNRSH